jgi:hypothetical protein
VPRAASQEVALVALVALVVLAVPAPAAADPSVEPTPEPAPAPDPAFDAAFPPPVRVRDAAPARPPFEHAAAIPSTGRGLVQHTAITVPKGAVDVAARGALTLGGLVGLAAGVGETTELSVELGAVSARGDTATVAGAGFKQVLASARIVQLSVGGSFRHVREGGDETSLGQMGGTLTLCTSATCAVLMSLGLSGLYVREEDDVRLSVTYGLSVGWPRARFLAEVVVIGETSMMLGGVRLVGRAAWGDVGLSTPIEPGDPVVPFATLGVRL